MVSLRNRTALEESNSNPKAEGSQTSKSQQKPNVSKKRKAENEAQEDHNEENLHRPSTPPAASKVWSPQPGESELAHLPSYERTPGRVGPIKTVNFDIKPDIKPFKGPPGKKVRKTAWEKDQEYKQFVRENEGHVFHQ